MEKNPAPLGPSRLSLQCHFNIKMRGWGESRIHHGTVCSWCFILQVVQGFFHTPYQIFEISGCLRKKISVLCKVVGQWHRPCDKSTLTRRLCKRTPLKHQGRKVKVTTAVVDKIEKTAQRDDCEGGWSAPCHGRRCEAQLPGQSVRPHSIGQIPQEEHLHEEYAREAGPHSARNRRPLRVRDGVQRQACILLD